MDLPPDPRPLAPNFFLVGAFKAGTTSFFRYLGQHPDVFLSPRKEPGFFAAEYRLDRLNSRWRRLVEDDAEALARYLDAPYRNGPQPRGRVSTWEDYLKLFRGASPGQAIGEATVAYLWSKTAARAIAQRRPDARILIMLRDPSDRALSQYNAMGLQPTESFAVAIRRSASDAGDGLLDDLKPFLEFGMYSEQVGRYLKAFPERNVGVYLYDDFVRDPDRMTRDAFRFLGLRDDVELDTTRRYNVSRVPRSRWIESVARPGGRLFGRTIPGWAKPPLQRLRYRSRKAVRMAPEDRSFLVGYYASDIERLAGLIGRDLSGWLTVDV